MQVAALENLLDTLQLAAFDAVRAVNSRGLSLKDHLRDVLARVKEVATHGIHQSVSAALATAQLRFGHELCHLEPGFPHTDRPEEQEELVGDFTAAVEAIAGAIRAQDVVNNLFLGP